MPHTCRPFRSNGLRLSHGWELLNLLHERRNMREEIKVHVYSNGKGRKNFYMRFLCPKDRKWVCRSTGCTRRRDAEREAAKWEQDLREGRYKPPSKTLWVEFRHAFEDQRFPELAGRTQEKIDGVFNAVETILKPERLAELTSSRVDDLKTALREAGRSPETIRGILAHLGAALKWAERKGMLVTVPDVEMPKRDKGGTMAKGRAICGEELDRMLAAVPRVVTKELRQRRTRGILALARLKDHPRHRGCLEAAERAGKLAREVADLRQEAERVAASWAFYLKGLWWSGLRLEESLSLFWDREDKLQPMFKERRPMLWIPGELQKSGKSELMPMAPELAQLLAEIPEADRTGRVFDPLGVRAGELTAGRVCRIVSAIGRAANVRVSDKNGRVKFASAHDLRRAFCFRWSERVMPAQLKEMARHSSIDTTMRYYVTRNAQATADAIWSAFDARQRPRNTGTESENSENSVGPDALTESLV
jgi:integrase